jgi:hypothetical protein
MTPVPRALLFVSLAGPDHLAVLARPGFVGAAPTRLGITRGRLPSGG